MQDPSNITLPFLAVFITYIYQPTTLSTITPSLIGWLCEDCLIVIEGPKSRTKLKTTLYKKAAYNIHSLVFFMGSD